MPPILQPGEEADLRQELSRLANAEKLSSLAKNALILLDEGSPDSQSITELLGEVVQSMTALANIDQELAGSFGANQLNFCLGW